MRQTRIARMYTRTLIFTTYFAVAGFTSGLLNKHSPLAECGPEPANLSHDEMYYSCWGRTNRAKLGRFVAGVAWPVTLPVIAGRALANNVGMP